MPQFLESIKNQASALDLMFGRGERATWPAWLLDAVALEATRTDRSPVVILSPMLPGVLIRRARPADVPGIITLFAAVAEERDSIGTEPGFDVAKRQYSILKSIDEAASCVLVAAVKDVVVGNLGIQAQHRQTLGSLGMMVAREHRGQGIGGRLLDDSLHWARESGLHKVDLGVWPHNTAAIALYRSRGFTVEGRFRRHFRRANGELWDIVTMGLILDTQSPGSSHPDAENL